MIEDDGNAIPIEDKDLPPDERLDDPSIAASIRVPSKGDTPPTPDEPTV